ncbi:heterokaryon incompatibility [Diplodia corticola]|uniref:Heterokaryon incompatibility n=1 Tax=Diplodia corticola TaxID=236234 RepID=A0A1J9RGX5_9PEZI|nr:heterokaryon incompatibility [Diplodia corticola]OJD31795.1 heterokaryon incompatibility [Diplodia corticola]
MSVICEATRTSYDIDDSAPSFPASAASRQDGLCKRCEVLALDDGKQGGQIKTENGEDFVSFGDKRWLDLDYKLEDRLPALPALSDSAKAGCGFCRLLKTAILRLVGGEKTPVPPDRSHVLAKHLRFLLKPGHNHDHFRSNHERDQTVLDELAVELFFSRDEHIDECRKPRPRFAIEETLFFEVHAAPGQCARWLGIARQPVAPSALSAPGKRRLNELIANCSPPQCSRTAHSFVPSRLVDVGGREGSQEPRLVLTSDRAKLANGTSSDVHAVPYVALSYCWGESQPPFTTKADSLPNHLQGIALKNLPKTICDAVLVTRALGLRYLWVDSLCIIQDDTEDWERECAQMKSIYSEAYLTISALAGDTCHSGFADRALSEPETSLQFKSSLRPSMWGQFYLKLPHPAGIDERSVFSSCMDPWDFPTSRVALTTRGWPLQEWLLSPRKLVFRDDMVYFQTGTHREAENGFITLEESLNEWANSLKNAETATQRWYELMEEYSQRELTYKQDRLSAISGLARDVSERLTLEYIAGLWASDLQKGLLWTTLAEDDEDKIPFSRRLGELTCTDAYMAPSWSWVSYSHGILWSLPGLDLSSSHVSLHPSCELISAITTPHGLDSFGRIKAGHLKIRGKFIQLPSPKVYLASKSQSRLLTIRTTKPDRDIASVELDFRFDHHITYEGFITPLPLRDTSLEGLSLLITSKLDDRTVGGLILLPTGVESEFRRVGIVLSNPRGMRAFDELETHKIRIV